MGCNCKWLEILVAVVVFVVVVWPELFGAAASVWIAIIAAIVLFIHALMCKSCCRTCDSGMGKSGGAKRKKRRK